MPRRTVLLIAAAGAALLGVLLVILYVNGVDSRARKGQEVVEVLYTKSAIQLGTSGSAAQKAGAFELRQVPRVAIATGALSNVSPIAGLNAITAIPAGQPVTSAQWGQPNTTTSLAIPGNKIAVAIQLGDPQRVAGYVTPGSEVAVFLTRGNNTTNLLLSRVQVIAVGTTTASSGSGNADNITNTILTLALDQGEASKVILGQAAGNLYFGLLSKDSRTGGNRRTTTSDLG